MRTVSRRIFMATAATMGATWALGQGRAVASKLRWHERRDLFGEGVASGDPQSDSVLLWTRRAPLNGQSAHRLTLEVSEDAGFGQVIASARAPLSEAADWTCRVLVGALKPSSLYWYRFIDEHGNGSRIGRTMTAPSADDAGPVRFAFVSCQNANQGAMNAYRRMIFEDMRAAEGDRLGFVLHLGDFVYEVVWYPEDKSDGMYYDRRLRDIVRYANGEKISDFHIPTTVDDYRALYRAYLHDPDLQDARARWPFVCMWDNHEYSWLSFQGIQVFGNSARPAQTRKVAANQAWFEYQPARVTKPSGPSLDTFDPPDVTDAPITQYDDNGLGREPNNLAAINSLKGYRALRWGKNVELILTDQHSYRSPDAINIPESAPFHRPDLPYFVPEEMIEIFDGGRSFNGAKPPETIRFGDADIPNPRKDKPPQTMLGVEQKAWFLSTLKASEATWKIWGNSLPTLSWRADPQNLPPESIKSWQGAGYATFGSGDWSGFITERGEIFDAVRAHGITGFAILAGDRHSFWAGLASKALPPKAFEPVAVEFVGGSVSSPGVVEAAEHKLPRDAPLRQLYLLDRTGEAHPRATINMLVKHGVRSCLEYADSSNLTKALALSNAELSPHLSFVDLNGHGYATVRVASEMLEVEFVCIPRPLERSERPDGGPIVYRVMHRARLWQKGEHPALEQLVLEGEPLLSI